MKRSVWVAVTLLSLLCSVFVPGAFGQAVYGSILGSVSDPSGAAVNGAKVTVTSQTRNVSTEATTNESGNYSVTHLIPDVYVVRVEAQGFKTLEFKDIQVSADTGSRVDGKFQVGGSSETVEVTSEAPQLKTDRADVPSSSAENSWRNFLSLTETSRASNCFRRALRFWAGATRPRRILRAANRSSSTANTLAVRDTNWTEPTIRIRFWESSL